MGEPWLHIRLDHQSFCFGNWWGWKIRFDPGCNLPKRLAYAIQLEKKGNQSSWVLDPFSRVSAGGEYWNRPVCFQIEPELAGIKMIAEPWDAVGGYRPVYPSKMQAGPSGMIVSWTLSERR